MNSKVLMFLVGTILLIPLSSFAQTSDLIPIDDKHYGYFSVDNIRITEYQYYKIIQIDAHVQVKDLALEDGIGEPWTFIILENENGKTYGPTVTTGQDCKTDIYTFSISGITGEQGGIGMHCISYNVEKEFNKFNVYYQRYSIQDATYHKYLIGNIDLNQAKNQNPLSNAGSYAQNLVNNASSYAQNINMTQPKDFFTQFFDWLKSLFHLS